MRSKLIGAIHAEKLFFPTAFRSSLRTWPHVSSVILSLVSFFGRRHASHLTPILRTARVRGDTVHQHDLRNRTRPKMRIDGMVEYG